MDRYRYNGEYRHGILYHCSHLTLKLINQKFRAEKDIEIEVDLTSKQNIENGTPLWILGPDSTGFVASGEIVKTLSVDKNKRKVLMGIEENRWPKQILDQKDLQQIEGKSREIHEATRGVYNLEYFQWMDKEVTFCLEKNLDLSFQIQLKMKKWVSKKNLNVLKMRGDELLYEISRFYGSSLLSCHSCQDEIKLVYDPLGNIICSCEPNNILFPIGKINNLKSEILKLNPMSRNSVSKTERLSHKCYGPHPHCSICGQCHTNMRNHDTGHR